MRYNRYDIMVKVSDDWYSNYPNDEVKMSVMVLSGVVRACAWGQDDTGLDLDVSYDTDERCENIYKSLVGYINRLKADEPINRERLMNQGWKQG